MRTHPYRHISVYETASRYFIVGSDASSSRFSVLKIDRTESKGLVFCDGGNEYSEKELCELLQMINDACPGNKGDKKDGKNRLPLTEKVTKANGLLGFVRFTEGYYMLLVTKASRVAHFGYHYLYKIEETCLLYMPNEPPPGSNVDEARYLKLFQVGAVDCVGGKKAVQSVDLTTNFYFSYTYDLSRTLQENALDAAGDADSRFVWNGLLVEPLVAQAVSLRWALTVVHGYVGQTVLRLPAAAVVVVLVGRRSARYAGTRFLKRGASLAGLVANDVETEQIVWDASTAPTLGCGRFTAFAQRRGSVPLLWSQDAAARPPVMMAKPPPIHIDLPDPFAQTAAAHFRELRQKYGHPLVVINLVKRRERRPHESLLHDSFVSAISYLNQFVPPNEAILYTNFDVARCNKVGGVLPKLEEIGYNVVPRQGWFQSFAPLHCHSLRPSDRLAAHRAACTGDASGRFLLQSGVSRTNCVDCLDRTNVAQFVVGKVALCCQLYAMGLLAEPALPLHTETCRQLEALYEEHGDTLALQYGGSQLVHSIRTYKKTSVFQERSRDVIQTLSRYYSNTFSDFDKQNAINLFLGVYRPFRAATPLWELTSDTFLHNGAGRPAADYCAWFDEPAESDDGGGAAAAAAVARTRTHSCLDEPNHYDLYYRTSELTSFDAVLPVVNAVRMVSVNSLDERTAAGQPFSRFWAQKPPKPQSAPPKTSGSAWSKHAERESSSEDEGAADSDAEVQYSAYWATRAAVDTSLDEQVTLCSGDAAEQLRATRRADRANSVLSTGLRSMHEAYGCELRQPSAADMAKYEAYAQLGGLKVSESDLEWLRSTRLANGAFGRAARRPVAPVSLFTDDSVFSVEPPTVSKESLLIYQAAVAAATDTDRRVRPQDARIYATYCIPPPAVVH